MAQRRDSAETTTNEHARTGKRKSHWTWRAFRAFLIFSLVLLAFRLLVGQLYHGPKTMPDVLAAMPGVPIFPLSDISPVNPDIQRSLAIPLLLMRWQGAARTEAVQLHAPADAFFIVDWYRRIAPTQGWRYVGQEPVGKGTRLIFLREREGLQVVIGPTRDILTPLQLIYLRGLSDAQVRQLSSTVPKDTSPRLSDTREHPATAPPVTAQPTPVPPPAAARPPEVNTASDPPITRRPDSSEKRKVTSATQRTKYSARHRSDAQETTRRRTKRSVTGETRQERNLPRAQQKPKQRVTRTTRAQEKPRVHTPGTNDRTPMAPKQKLTSKSSSSKPKPPASTSPQ